LSFGHWRRDLRNGMKLRVRGRLARGALSVEHLRKLHRSPIRAPAAAASGPRRVAVLLFNFANDRSQPWTPAQAAATMFSGPGSVNAYFTEESFGSTSMTGDVFGWYALPSSSGGCGIDSWAAAANAAAAAAGVNLQSYQHIVYAFPYVMDCGWAGLAEIPGSHVWINGSFVLRTLGHELGHNLGVHHAATLSCLNGAVRVALGSDCSYSEYGDPFDIMGQGSRHTSAWHKGQIGWLDPLAQQTVTASGTYTISPQEWASGGVRSLRNRRGTTNNYLYLEFRRPFGSAFDTFSVSDPVVNGVTIRMAPDYGVINLSYLIDATPTTSSYLDAPLANGQTFTDSAYDISVKTVAVSATGATVDVTIGGTPPPPLPPPRRPTRSRPARPGR
jgi:Gametolysin peptidase M11